MAARGVPVELRGLSLTQPWATLIAVQEKLIETRSWKTSYRGWLAIHASKRFPQDAKWLCSSTPFAATLLMAGIGIETTDDLPTSAIIAIAKLEDVRWTHDPVVLGWAPLVSRERAFGNYRADDVTASGRRVKRYAWRLSGVRRLKTPIPCAGALSLWPVHETLRAALSREILWLRTAGRDERLRADLAIRHHAARDDQELPDERVPVVTTQIVE